MPTLRDATLVDASVAETATLAEAARSLSAARVPALAVLGQGRRVLGLFTENDLVAGFVPGYVRELRHTAFAEDDLEALARRGREAAGEPVTRHMSRPVALELDTSATHAAERFLHGNCGAVAVTDGDRFVGVLAAAELVRLLLATAGLGDG
jgi:CBS domain-containing protein